MQFTFDREYQLQVKQKKISVIEWGDPDLPAVLCMHGWLDNAASFHYLAPYLKHKYRLIAFEVPGHGQSEHLSVDADYQFVSGLSTIDAVLNTLNIEQCQVIGHSMGGALALLYAGVVSDRFSKLALIDSLGALTTPAQDTVKQLSEAIEDRRKVRGNKRYFPDLESAAKAREQVSELDWQTLYPLIERGVMRTLKGFQWSSDARLKQASWLRMTEEQHDAILQQVKAKVLLLMAKSGLIRQFPYQRRLANIADHELIEVEGGHHFHMQYPEETAHLIQQFLD
ncbi:alpha/beta fold hydrolase [Kangiella sp. TOML190]|uniref:alpha/beta fold hydrolase n=1 Tax=Kangiella sp. TOML190 TaxID=2931351 RepID=UPI00203E9F5C|nr:alpha/beta hydrolase [Kangiella sp. TOML190]